MELHDRLVLHGASWTGWVDDDLCFFLDPDGPNWCATDARGASLMGWINGTTPFGELVRRYQQEMNCDGARAWLHVHDFCQQLIRFQMVSALQRVVPLYCGRAAHMALGRLDECWFHLNDECNLACRHCLVSSSPKGSAGLPPEQILKLADEALTLGAERFYFTGGEPFLRLDLPALLKYLALDRGVEVIVLTNALLLNADLVESLRSLPRERCKFQISLDGATAQTNDSLRGKGTFHRILEGIRTIARAGFATSITAVVLPSNLAELPQLAELARSVGAESLHLMWPHRRGRLLSNGRPLYPDTEILPELIDETRQATLDAGVSLDNWDSLALRVNGLPFIKYDLANSGWNSLCVGPNGRVYPAPALANDPDFDAGSALHDGLAQVWQSSPLLDRLRRTSLTDIPAVVDDPFRFLTGGGDLDHLLIANKPSPAPLVPDPYYPVYVYMAKRIMADLAVCGRRMLNTRSGYNPPPVYCAMGQGALPAGAFTVLPGPETITLGTLHSNCVLSFDVERPRAAVREFYGAAAAQPKADLCCPVKYDPAETAHIPDEVLQRFYGCGSPSTMASLRPGETYCDLGAGGGIDCFIAAKKVGPAGRVIGIDMTEQMLAVANRNKPLVAERLGFDCVEFRQGFLERIPVEDNTVDCITSNCVINLSPDKPAVFREMWRLCRQHGRIVIADIVSERPVPPAVKANEHLWGECIAGALTEREILSELESAGFYGLQILRKSYWKSVAEHSFFSVTIRGYKYGKEPTCRFIGQRAIYLGPGKALVDEEGHQFPRNIAIEVCTDTAAKLRAEPYAGSFLVVESGTSIDQPPFSCNPAKGCC
ncbi:MAG: methyltransferase domain-containing protein [Deltaproteobacteria bacterium]|nr:methyltransferase domain-containing protein [Deltaproteobacteria bacterium]